MLEDGAWVTDENGSNAMITQQTAANVTTGTTLGNTYAALLPANPSPSPNKYAAAAVAINQLSANQMAMWLHMQNLSLLDSAPPMHVANPAVVYNPPRTAAGYQQHWVPVPVYAPSIQALNIPVPFHSGGFSQGCGGHSNGGRTRRHTGHGGHGTNPFGNVGQGAGTVFVPGGVVLPPYGPHPPTVAPDWLAQNHALQEVLTWQRAGLYWQWIRCVYKKVSTRQCSLSIACEIIGDLVHYLVPWPLKVSWYQYPDTVFLYLCTCLLLVFKTPMRGFFRFTRNLN